MSYQCQCGHAHDEHDPKTLECEVENCPCIYYDDNPEAEDE